ncbi:MAG: hypothetical protein Q4F97_06765 [Bacteroidales bacterium]|nr:hypothetical protein [Bacteroidales bacterium]
MKAIYYKEWIKTRWAFILSILVLAGFSLFCIINIFRMIEMKGAVHIWEVMIQKDALFISLLTFLPMIIGIIVGITQYVPEMHQKCLKLTLHLPFNSMTMIAVMISFGFVSLIIIFSAVILLIAASFSLILAPELVKHIILSSIPWFLAGIASYIFTAWITLEPTWKRRIINILIAVLVLKIFFIDSVGEGYNCFLPYMAITTLLFSTFIFLSVSRFKEGKQD